MVKIPGRCFVFFHDVRPWLILKLVESQLGRGTSNNEHIIKERINLNGTIEISPYFDPRPNADHPAHTPS
jgi:hypothetical protein